MKRVMLDTNICIYLIKNHPQSVREKFESHDIGSIAISSIVASELYYGAYKSAFISKNLSALKSFLSPFQIVDYDMRAAIEYGKLRSELERIGKTIGALDMLVAAHAISLGATLVTNNTKEFERVEKLKIENWV